MQILEPCIRQKKRFQGRRTELASFIPLLLLLATVRNSGRGYGKWRFWIKRLTRLVGGHVLHIFPNHCEQSSPLVDFAFGLHFDRGLGS